MDETPTLLPHPPEPSQYRLGKSIEANFPGGSWARLFVCSTGDLCAGRAARWLKIKPARGDRPVAPWPSPQFPVGHPSRKRATWRCASTPMRWERFVRRVALIGTVSFRRRFVCGTQCARGRVISPRRDQTCLVAKPPKSAARPHFGWARGLSACVGGGRIRIQYVRSDKVSRPA